MENFENTKKLIKIQTYQLGQNKEKPSVAIFIDESGSSHLGEWQLTSAFDSEPTIADIGQRMVEQNVKASHYVVETTEDGRYLVSYFYVIQAGGLS